MGLEIIAAALIFLSAFTYSAEIPSENFRELFDDDEILKKDVFKILDTKCNVCHRKQNPFMIFRKKNMSKRANKINQMVFVEKRMPKGDKIRLTELEIKKLKEWLLTQNVQ